MRRSFGRLCLSATHGSCRRVSPYCHNAWRLRPSVRAVRAARLLRRGLRGRGGGRAGARPSPGDGRRAWTRLSCPGAAPRGGSRRRSADRGRGRARASRRNAGGSRCRRGGVGRRPGSPRPGSRAPRRGSSRPGGRSRSSRRRRRPSGHGPRPRPRDVGWRVRRWRRGRKDRRSPRRGRRCSCAHQGRFLIAREIRRKPKGNAPNPLEGRPQPPLNLAYGEVAEWSIAADLKSAEPQGSGGSNPSLSAPFISRLNVALLFCNCSP